MIAGSRLCSLLLCYATAAMADITYNVTVDTSSITATMGSLDFNFNPGPLVTQYAQLEILNFSSDGSLAGDCPCGTGDVTGQLPSTLMFETAPPTTIISTSLLTAPPFRSASISTAPPSIRPTAFPPQAARSPSACSRMLPEPCRS